MRIDFTKMHGTGNDFIVFNAAADTPLPTTEQWRALADRRRGIGFDQALVIMPPRDPDTAAYYRIFNADGGEVEQCGNGARCVAALLHQQSRGARDNLTLGSPGGRVQARILADGRIAVNMGPPDFEPASLPFDAAARRHSYTLRIDAGAGVREWTFGAVSMGNPHAVLQVQELDTAPVEAVGRALQASPEFPRQVNVGFMHVLDRGHIRLRVYERGAGETLACGTGACAAVAVGRDLDLLDADVEVHVPGGRLSVHWLGEGKDVWLTGPAQFAFAGHVEF